MRVLVVHNEPVLSEAHPEAESEREILDTADQISDRLKRAGFEVRIRPVGRDFSTFLAYLQEARPHVVFNLFEGLGDDPLTEIAFARFLENHSVPFTGCSSHALWQAGRKDIAKWLFRQADLPTPDFFVVEELPPTDCPLEWPVIVKPAFRDASIGIDHGSVVTDSIRFRERAALLAEQYGFPILVESFIAGAEISAAVLDGPEPRVLPEVETLFVSDSGDYPIVTYDAKWDPGSRDYQSTPLRHPDQLDPRLAERISDLAKKAFRLFGCRDFATVDIRLNANNDPFLLDVNRNADLTPTSCLMQSFQMAGIRYDDFLVEMVHAARKRARQSIGGSA
ncbi:MAG: D-alanine--D-alanine ligase family protein [Methylocella sp.]